MSADPSPYAVLGLAPGADWPEVERAYKELIKRHHPDRSGGDAKRAAEIIHAYRELKRARDRKGAIVLVEDEPGPKRRRRWLWLALGVAAAGLLAVTAGPLKPPRAERAPAAATTSAAPEPMDSELAETAIDASVLDALRMFREEDEMALAAASRNCHRQFRAAPNLEMFDRCAAFDDAVVMLQDRDPLRSQGPFSELAVTSRQLNAGTMLSSDALAIDSRLDRIRLHVELALAPPPLPVPAANGAGDDAG